LPNIDGVRIIGGKSHSSPWLVLMRQSYTIVVSIPAEKHNRYIFTYIATYPPSDAHVFNATWTALHTLQERIHVLRKWPQDVPRSPCLRCAVVASRMTDMQPLPHNRNCPHANLVLRGQVWDSHHPTGWYLPSYLFVGVSIQNSKLHKVNAECKFQLACHLLRLL
jgi:hypothetical protein